MALSTKEKANFFRGWTAARKGKPRKGKTKQYLKGYSAFVGTKASRDWAKGGKSSRCGKKSK